MAKTDWKNSDVVKPGDMNQIGQEINDLRMSSGYGVTTNSGNAYEVNIEPAPTALVEGKTRITIKANADSTGPVTINVNGLGAKSIKRASGSDASLKAGGVYTLVYDGSAFILQGEGGDYGTATADVVLAGSTIGTEDGIVEGKLTPRIPNIAIDGSFDFGLEYFTQAQVAAVSAGIKRTGRYSIRLYPNNSRSYVGYSRDGTFTPEANSKYYVSVWAYVESYTNGDPVLAVRAFNGNNQLLHNYTTAIDTTKMAQWQMVSMIFDTATWTAAALGDCDAFPLHDSGTTSNKFVIYVDDFMIINLTKSFGAGKEPPQHVMDQLVQEGGGWWTHAVNTSVDDLKQIPDAADVLVGKTAYANGKKLVGKMAPRLVNLVKDGSFEGGAVEIKENSSIVTDVKLYGNKSLKMVCPAGAPEVFVHMTTPIKTIAGHKYYVRCAVMSDTAGASVELWPRPANGASGVADLIGSANTWQLVSGILTYPSTMIMSPRLDLNGGGVSQPMTAWYDGYMIIDLTDTFGQGKEPGLLEMNAIVGEAGGYWDTPQENYAKPYSILRDGTFDTLDYADGRQWANKQGVTKDASGAVRLVAPAGDYTEVIQYQRIKGGHKYYAAALIWAPDGPITGSVNASSQIDLVAIDGLPGVEYDFVSFDAAVNPPVTTQKRYSGVITVSNSVVDTGATFRFFTYSTNPVLIDNMVLVDLTEIYGKGKEPPIEYIDELYANNGYYFWNPTLNLGINADVVPAALLKGYTAINKWGNGIAGTMQPKQVAQGVIASPPLTKKGFSRSTPNGPNGESLGVSSPFVLVTGLTFRPSLIILQTFDPTVNIGAITLYQRGMNLYGKGTTPTDILAVIIDTNGITMGNTSGDWGGMFRLEDAAYIRDTEFQLPVRRAGLNYFWTAIS